MLARGARLTELLKQPQFSPMPVEEQVISIYAGTKGYLDAIPVGKVGEFERRLLAELKSGSRRADEHPRHREMKPETEKTLVASWTASPRPSHKADGGPMAASRRCAGASTA